MTETTTILGSVFNVFREIISWFIESINSVSAIFYSTSTGLTLIGTLAVVGLGIAITLLLVNVVKDYLRFR